MFKKMLKTLILHKYLNLKRSSFFESSIIVKIGKGLLTSLFMLNFVAIGFVLDLLLLTALPNMPISESLFYVSILYFLVLLCCQIIVLRSELNNVLPYYCLPIKKNTLITFGIFSNTPSKSDYLSLVFYLIVFSKFAYNGMLSVADVFCYTLVAFFVSVLIGVSIRWVKAFGSILLSIASLVFVLSMVYVLFSIDISVIVLLLTNRFFVLFLVVALPMLTYLIIKSQFYHEFYSVMEGGAKVGKDVMMSVTRWRLLSPYDKFILSLLFRNKSTICWTIYILVIGILNYLMGIKGGIYKWFAPTFGPFVCGVTLFMSHPILHYTAFSFDGLYVSNRTVLRNLLTGLYKVGAVINVIPTLLCAIFSGEYLLTFSFYVFAHGVVCFSIICGNRHARKRVDVFKVMRTAKFLEPRILLWNLVWLVSLATISIGYYMLDKLTFSCILYAVGFVFILTSRLWINNTNTVFMKRRYENMAGLRGEM